MPPHVAAIARASGCGKPGAPSRPGTGSSRPTRDRMATPFHAGSPWGAAPYRAVASSPARSAAKASSASFVSCRHTTSGRRSSSHGRNRGTRCLIELTFQVAMRIASDGTPPRDDPPMTTTANRPSVVVVGGGFGGLPAALKLAPQAVDVTLVDRRNFHLFQPLAYQVATGALSAAEVAHPLRSIFKRHANVRVLLAEVTGFDLAEREVGLGPVLDEPEPPPLRYDTLVVAGGAQYSYFGHDEWADAAPELKSMESLIDARRRILRAFESAELEQDAERRRAWLTFVVVGAGPTGVEMAGQIGEIARDTLRRDFRTIDPAGARIILAEALDRILGTFPPSLSAKAERSLAELGVTTMTNHPVVGLDGRSVTMNRADGETVVVPTRTAIWAAGVTASPLAKLLADAAGADIDRAGRLQVAPDLTVPGHA